jgi:uncharacterized protein (TIGR03792 family)
MGDQMVIEMQRLRVKPEIRDQWVAADEEIWTTGLYREPGFVGKEVWIGEGDEVLLVIRWRSQADWEEMPKPWQEALDRAFRQRMPEGWEIVEVRSYQVAG